jgi:hypothetical protein
MPEVTYAYDAMYPLWRAKIYGCEIAVLEQVEWEALVSYGTDLQRSRLFFSTKTAREWIEDNARDLADHETRDDL